MDTGLLGRDLRTALLAAMRAAVCDGDWDALRKQDLSSLLITYLTWQTRQICAAPRSIATTRRFTSQRANLEQSTEHRVESLLIRIAAGEDLTPFLSKRARTAWSAPHPRTPMQYHQHLDVLLFGWGIHHLHVRAGGAGDELVLGIFTDDTAYLIDVGDHGSFDDETLLRDAAATWPDLLPRVKGGIRLATDTTGQLAPLRNGGVTTLFEQDGRVYMPYEFGLTTAGTPMSATTKSNEVMHALSRLNTNPALLDGYFAGPTDLQEVRVELDGFHILLTHRGRGVVVT